MLSYGMLVVPYKELPESKAAWQFLTDRILFPELRSHRDRCPTDVAVLDKSSANAAIRPITGLDDAKQQDNAYLSSTDGNSSRLCHLEQELMRMQSFLFHPDRARAACSMLLQRAVVREAMECSDMDIRIERNSHGKPVLIQPRRDSAWNFNVSHHGDYVAICWHDTYQIGLDLVDITQSMRCPGGADEFLGYFNEQFSPAEMKYIKTGQYDPTSLSPEPNKYLCESAILRRFYVNWSLKEALVKASGCGITGFNLREAEFQIAFDDEEDRTLVGAESHSKPTNTSGSATVKIRGIDRPDWIFGFGSIDASHVAAVAMCTGPDASLVSNPIADVVDMNSSNGVDSQGCVSVGKEVAGRSRPTAIRILNSSSGSSLYVSDGDSNKHSERTNVECIKLRMVRVSDLAPVELRSEWQDVLENSGKLL